MRPAATISQWIEILLEIPFGARHDLINCGAEFSIETSMPPVPADLPDTDKALVAAVRNGKSWPPNPKRPVPEELADPEYVKNLPTIRGTTIRALCIGLWDDVPLHPQGITIIGARIVEDLDLSCATVRAPLRLLNCHIPTRLNFLQSSFPFLNLSGCRLEKGLVGDGMRVVGSLFCRNNFTAKGEVRLLSAQIGGNVDFTKATLENSGAIPLNADYIKITGGLFCRNGFSTKGDVRLIGAEIGTDADFTDATLENPGSNALSADRIRITGTLLCRESFVAKGTVRLQVAQIGGEFNWKPAVWSGTLQLLHAQAGQWRDNWNGSRWDCNGETSIDLRDFSYGAFVAGTSSTSTPKIDAESRIAWIKASLGDSFFPGPYETLARVLRASGDDEGANTVALEKRRHWTRHRLRSDVTPSWQARLRFAFVGWTLDAITGYGYQPWRGIGWLLAFLLLGWGIFGDSSPTNYGGRGIMKPAIPIAYVQPLVRCQPGQIIKAEGSNEQICKEPVDRTLATNHAIEYALPLEYPPFSAFWYSLDTLIPLVDLGQGTAWSPSPIAGPLDDFEGWFVLVYLYIHIIAGWVLTSLTVVALTGIIKKAD